MEDRMEGNGEQLNDEQLNDEQQNVEQLNIEGSISSIIVKIKKDRNRACIQNIHTFINRRGINIEAETVIEIMNDLLLRGVVTDEGKEGKESFFIIDSPSEGEGLNNIVNRDSKQENSFNALHDFIDEKSYSVLINKIKSEIKLALNDALSYDTIKSIKQANNNKNENKCY